MIVLDAGKKPYTEFTEINLDEQEVSEDEPQKTIAGGLDPGAYGINPAEYYL